jgi:uncharacterized lipoprotein
MNLYRVCLIALAACVLAGCFNRDRQPIYVESEEVSEIEVPEDLSLPNVRRTYDIPGTFLPQLAAVGDESRPPVVLSSAEAEASRSHIRFGPTGLYLEVEDEPGSVWRRLGFSLNRGGMNVRQVDESDRRYLFDFTHDPIEVERSGLARMAFWRSDERLDYSGRYQVRVQEDGDTTRVVLLGDGGEVIEMDQAEFILAILRERLG